MKKAKKRFRIEADSEAFILVLVLNPRNILDLSGFEVEYAHCCNAAENGLRFV